MKRPENKKFVLQSATELSALYKTCPFLLNSRVDASIETQFCKQRTLVKFSEDLYHINMESRAIGH